MMSAVPDWTETAMPLAAVFTAHSIKNRREYQEDRFTCSQRLDLPTRWGLWSCWCVFDGHGGDLSSEYLSANFIRVLCTHILKSPNQGTSACMVSALEQLQQDWDHTIGQTNESGTTVLVALIDHVRTNLILLNLGDSRGVLYNDSGKVLLQTLDQGLDLPAERLVVEQRQLKRSFAPCQVTLLPGEPWRVNGNLAMSSSFADSGADLLGCVGRRPDIYIYQLQSNIKYKLVLASDGLWDELTVKQVGVEIRDHKPLNAQQLVHQAKAVGRQGDNITCAIVTMTC
jgi:serine/threonine protein phosphatase PrpC